MRKVSSRVVLLFAIFVVAYNVLLFVLNDSFGVFDRAFWIAYAFIMFAVIMGCITAFGFVKRRGAGGAKDYALFGIPLLLIASVYAAVEFILGTVFMSVHIADLYANLLPQLILALIYIGIFMITLITKNFIQGGNKEIDKKIGFISEVSGVIALAATAATDEDLKKELLRYSDDIKYSDPIGNKSLAKLEKAIEANAYKIKDRVTDGKDIDGVKELLAQSKLLLAERNMQCKALK